MESDDENFQPKIPNYFISGLGFFSKFDKFFLDYNYRLSENFYLQDTWSTSPVDKNPIIISGYRFNESYYKSSKIFADIIESKSSIQQYIRELNDLFNSFLELKSLSIDELE